MSTEIWARLTKVEWMHSMYLLTEWKGRTGGPAARSVRHDRGDSFTMKARAGTVRAL